MEVLDWLAERGFTDVAEVTTAQEKLVFSLPQELKRDIKAAAAARADTVTDLVTSVER
jgi:4-hydroxy-3-methylbut-2-enyl diphosphate reductase